MNDPKDTRQRLIDAGRKLLATRGFDGTSIRALTDEAGANLGAVTYHFESKEKLYQAVLEEVLGPVQEHLEMLKRMPVSAPQRLEFFIRGMFQHLRENPEMPRFMVQEIVLGENPSPEILKMVRTLVSVLTGIIQEGQAVGTIREGDSVPVQQTTWNLSLPDDYRVLTVAGNLDGEPSPELEPLLLTALGPLLCLIEGSGE